MTVRSYVLVEGSQKAVYGPIQKEIRKSKAREMKTHSVKNVQAGGLSGAHQGLIKLSGGWTVHLGKEQAPQQLWKTKKEGP